jgi:hypothetical protein
MSNDPIGPAKCPITGLPFFMNIEHPELGMIATYGGPFDSYTIPTADDDDEGCFRSERYDHDVGGWIEGGEPWPLHQMKADDFIDHYEWRDALRDVVKGNGHVPMAEIERLRKLIGSPTSGSGDA